MDRPSEIDPEILQLLVEMSGGEATDEQYARLDERVRTDPEVCSAVVTGLTHLADLEWESRGPVGLDTYDEHAGEARPEGCVSLALVSEESEYTQSLRVLDRELESTARRNRGSWLGLAASFLIGVGATLWFAHPWGSTAKVERPAGGPSIAAPPKPDTPVATLVRSTSYLWDAQAGVAIETGAALHAGNSVALLDGVAEVEFDHGVTIRIKGPAIFSLSATGIPELKYGKLLLRNDHAERFLVDVPMARTVIPGGSLVGIDAFGEEVVVHSLAGNAAVVPTVRQKERIAIKVGQALRLRKDARSELAFFSSAADAHAFDFDANSDADQITITADYADLVKESQPLGYWRFENITSGTVPNEVGPRHELHLVGEHVHNLYHAGNGWAEFAIRESAGCFVSADTLDELADSDYSVELWMRPSHFHRGAIVSLVEKANDQQGSVERHGLILETHAVNPATQEALEGRPKSIRFLHRSPPDEILTGTSCFSSTPYRPQVWQHLAAVKEGAQMRLFVDGTEVATEQDESQLPKNLSLVVGQLFSFGSVRPYVGELDELAIYPRALSIEDLRKRIELVRPGSLEGTSHQ